MWGDRAREAGIQVGVGTGNKDSNSHPRHRPPHPRATVLRAPLESHFLSPFLRWRNDGITRFLLGIRMYVVFQQRARGGGGTQPEVADNSRGSRGRGLRGPPGGGSLPSPGPRLIIRVQNSQREPTIPTPLPLPNVSEKLHLSQDDERRAKRVGKTAQLT